MEKFQTELINKVKSITVNDWRLVYKDAKENMSTTKLDRIPRHIQRVYSDPDQLN
jgi:hypothetical protein